MKYMPLNESRIYKMTSSTVPVLFVVFRPGKEFVFHYVSQVVMGIPNSGRQVAGLKVAATVRAQFEAADKVIVAVRFNSVLAAII